MCSLLKLYYSSFCRQIYIATDVLYKLGCRKTLVLTLVKSLYLYDGQLYELHSNTVNIKPMARRSTCTLRKHAYSNILNLLQPKTENFQIKNSDIFHIPAQNIDCGYSLESPWRGGSNEYPQSRDFFSKIRKILYTPANPSFTI